MPGLVTRNPLIRGSGKVRGRVGRRPIPQGRGAPFRRPPQAARFSGWGRRSHLWKA
jgi:hypothetical protein